MSFGQENPEQIQNQNEEINSGIQTKSQNTQEINQQTSKKLKMSKIKIVLVIVILILLKLLGKVMLFNNKVKNNYLN